MNQEIQKVLNKEEKILWTGKPQQGKIFDEDTKKNNWLRIALASAVCLLLNGVYIGYCLSSGTDVKIGVVVVVVVLAFFAVLNIFTTWKALGKIVYVITDQRVMIYHSSDKAISLPLKKIDETLVVTGANGMDSLCIGSPTCKLSAGKLRNAGVEGRRVEVDENAHDIYPVFYNLPDAANVKKFLDGLVFG